MDRPLASSPQKAPGYPCDIQDKGPIMILEEVNLSDSDDSLKDTLQEASLCKADTLLSLFKSRKQKLSRDALTSLTLKQIQLIEEELAKVKQLYKRRR